MARSFYAPRGSSFGDRLLAMSVEGRGGCREWIAWLNQSGYGRLKAGGRKQMAHRLAYETWVGPIPEGMSVDHLCFNRRCINPEHLRLLTPVENGRNQRRALATHCARGHEYTPENTVPQGRNRPHHRCCRACRQVRARERAAARAAA